MAGGGEAGGMAGGMGQQPGGMGGQMPSYMGGQAAREFNPNPVNAGFGPNVDNFGAPPMQQGMQGGMGQMGGALNSLPTRQIDPSQINPMRPGMMPNQIPNPSQINSIPEYARPYVQQQQDPAQQMNNLNNMSNMLRGRPGMPGMMPNQIPDPSQIRPMPPRMMPNQIPNPSQVNQMPPRQMVNPPNVSRPMMPNQIPMQPRQAQQMPQPSGGITRLTRPNRLRGR